MVFHIGIMSPMKKIIFALTLFAAMSATAFAQFAVTDAFDVDYKAAKVAVSGGKLTLTGPSLDKTIPLDEVAQIGFSEWAAAVPRFSPKNAAIIELSDGSSVKGELVSGSASSLSLKTAFADAFEVKFENLRKIVFDANDPVPVPKDCSTTPEDTLYLTNSDTDTGVVKIFTKDTIVFKSSRFRKEVTYQVSAVYAVLFYPMCSPPKEPEGLFAIASGKAKNYEIKGTITEFNADTETVKLATLYSAEVVLPFATLSIVFFKNGKAVYLSDMEPASAETKPYFDGGQVFFTWERDSNVRDGGPIVINGVEYRKGLSAHSRTELKYALSGKFARFTALVGLDETAHNENFKGSVAFIVLGDGKELFNSGNMAYGDPAKKIALDVSSVSELELVVDFGENANILDFADWADAKLLRK